MTPLRQRFIGDMKLRGPRTHHTTKLHPLRRRIRKNSQHQPAEYLVWRRSASTSSTCSKNGKCRRRRSTAFVSAVQFSLPAHAGDAVTSQYFPRVKRPLKLPVVLQSGRDSAVLRSYRAASTPRRSDDLLRRGLRISKPLALFPSPISHPTHA